MTDTRTPEQQAADEAIRTAIQNALAVYGWSGDGVLVDYAVVTASQRFADDGSTLTSYARLMTNGAVPHYRIIGLLDVHLTELRIDAANDDEETGEN